MPRFRFDEAISSPSILCTGAQCADVEIGYGGLSIRWAKEYPKARFRICVFSGDERRVRESRAAMAGLLDRSRFELRFYPFRVSYFPSQQEAFKDALETLKGEERPDVILSLNSKPEFTNLTATPIVKRPADARHHLVWECQAAHNPGSGGSDFCPSQGKIGPPLPRAHEFDKCVRQSGARSA